MMNKFFVAGIWFSYTGACVPEIPNVTDVLYALRLSDEEVNYTFCMGNSPLYVNNVHLVAASLLNFDLQARQQRTLIATAILMLCPERAKCLCNGEYTAALKEAGRPIPEGLNRNETLRLCGCKSCSALLASEQQAHA